MEFQGNPGNARKPLLWGEPGHGKGEAPALGQLAPWATSGPGRCAMGDMHSCGPMAPHPRGPCEGPRVEKKSAHKTMTSGKFPIKNPY